MSLQEHTQTQTLFSKKTVHKNTQ